MLAIPPSESDKNSTCQENNNNKTSSINQCERYQIDWENECGRESGQNCSYEKLYIVRSKRMRLIDWCFCSLWFLSMFWCFTLISCAVCPTSTSLALPIFVSSAEHALRRYTHIMDIRMIRIFDDDAVDHHHHQLLQLHQFFALRFPIELSAQSRQQPYRKK